MCDLTLIVPIITFISVTAPITNVIINLAFSAKTVHSSSTNCTVRNLHTSGIDASHVQ